MPVRIDFANIIDPNLCEFEIREFYEEEDWECDLIYHFGDPDWVSSGLKQDVIKYYGLSKTDAKSISERLRAYLGLSLHSNRKENFVEVLPTTLMFYDRLTDGSKDDYPVDGLNINQFWFQDHIIPKIKNSLYLENH